MEEICQHLFGGSIYVAIYDVFKNIVIPSATIALSAVVAFKVAKIQNDNFVNNKEIERYNQLKATTQLLNNSALVTKKEIDGIISYLQEDLKCFHLESNYSHSFKTISKTHFENVISVSPLRLYEILTASECYDLESRLFDFYSSVKSIPPTHDQLQTNYFLNEKEYNRITNLITSKFELALIDVQEFIHSKESRDLIKKYNDAVESKMPAVKSETIEAIETMDAIITSYVNGTDPQFIRIRETATQLHAAINNFKDLSYFKVDTAQHLVNVKMHIQTLELFYKRVHESYENYIEVYNTYSKRIKEYSDASHIISENLERNKLKFT